MLVRMRELLGAELQERRNRPVGGSSVLEVILVSSACLAVVGFGIWFFGFAGASPAAAQHRLLRSAPLRPARRGWRQGGRPSPAPL